MSHVFLISGKEGFFSLLSHYLDGREISTFSKISPWDIWMKYPVSNFQANFSDWWLRYFCEITLIWMSQDLTDDDKSTLVQVMAWCHQATSHYLSQCWPRSMSPYSITRPQWVKSSTITPVWPQQNQHKLWAYLTGPAVLRNWVDKTNKIRLKKVSEFHPGPADMYTTGHVYQCSNINWATIASCPDDNDSSPPSHWNLTIARGLIQSS